MYDTSERLEDTMMTEGRKRIYSNFGLSSTTDLPAYSDTVYSDTPLTVTPRLQ